MVDNQLRLLDFHWKILVTYYPSAEAMNCYISIADETDLNCGLSNAGLSLL